MASQFDFAVTTVGAALLADRLAAGEPVVFTRIGLGDHTSPGIVNLEDATDLADEELTSDISGMSRDGAVCKLSAEFSNTGLVAGFHKYEIGLFAEDPANPGQEILVVYGHPMPLGIDHSKADWIPPAGGVTAMVWVEQIALTVANDLEVSVSIAPAVYGDMLRETYDPDEDGVVDLAEVADRAATLVVAASDTTATGKLGADYVCDGTDDDVEINAAINALPAIGGKVLLLEGTYSLAVPDDPANDAAILISGLEDIVLEGQGPGTMLMLVEPTGETDMAIKITNFTRVEIRNLTIKRETDSGGFTAIYADAAGAQETDLVVENVHIRQDGNGLGVISYASKTTVSNCRIDVNTQGIHVYGDYSEITGNFIDCVDRCIETENGADHAHIRGNICRLAYAYSTADRYAILAGGNYASIIGNTAIATVAVGGGFTDYGIRLAATSTKCIVTGNHVTTSVSDVGTDNALDNNVAVV